MLDYEVSCDLLSKLYFYTIGHNYLNEDYEWLKVVICFQNCIFTL